MHVQQIRRLQSSCRSATAHCNTQHRRCHTVTAAAAAAKAGPLVGLQRLPNAQESTTVVERRAADVAVVGGGITAVLSAYTLARAGKKASGIR
jgi:heterodisulfide reductase subunit A-like polyferredoxin